MADRLIFLSHIHEEKQMALALKDAIESEFAGFIDVFVSSDGSSIPAGANFLKRIEDSLIKCEAAVYLISPTSITRNWINFELGAVWLRNVSSQRTGSKEIPTIPMCHSGCTPGNLPTPLNNLNAIQANQSAELERAFQSIQSAVGGRGTLKTDFDELMLSIVNMENYYMLGIHVKEMLAPYVKNFDKIIDGCEKKSYKGNITLDLGVMDNSSIEKLRRYESGPLKGSIEVQTGDYAILTGPMGSKAGTYTSITLPKSLILSFKDKLREQ